MTKHIEKLAREAARTSVAKPLREAFSQAITEIARRSADHEREMERIKGEIARGARAGKGRFRI